MAMVIINNDPELSEAFNNPAAQRFLKQLFHQFDDAYGMKYFIKKGFKKSFEEQIQQLKNSFRPIEKVSPVETIHDENAFVSVIRCYDGVTFKVGDSVIDIESPTEKRMPILRMYEDDRGLHVKLDCGDGSFTWRYLGRVEHNLDNIDEIEDDD